MTPSDYQTTEENFTPDNYEEVKDNERYHHSLKGCQCEIRVEEVKDYKNQHASWAFTKYCHTHKVLCSKTGWELGWYGGTETVKNERTQLNWDKCKCGRKYINSTPLQLGLCPKCFQREATDEQGTALYFWRMERQSRLALERKAKKEDKTHQRRLELDREFERKNELKKMLQNF